MTRINMTHSRIEMKQFVSAVLRSLLVLFIVSAIGTGRTFGQISNYTLLTGGVASETMSSGTSLLIFSGVDDASSAVASIGFNFQLAGVTYSQFSVNSNGLMKLGGTAVSATASNVLTGAGSDFPKISPYWDDLTTGTTGIVHYRLSGSAPNRKLIVEWNVTVPKNIAAAAGVKFQVWLFETSNIIQFVYGSAIPINNTNGGYTTGIATGTSDFICVNASTNLKSLTEINTNTAAVTSTRYYKFTPPVPTTPPNCATNLFPADLSTGISPDFSGLSWANGGGNPSGYDVYFGTNPASLPLVSSNQGTLTYSPGLLQWNTTYFWKVLPRNIVGPAVGCSTMQFSTGTLLDFSIHTDNGINYTSITTTGTPVSSWKNGNNTDDNLSNTLPIGFAFNYQGANYSNFLVSTNGFITFNTTTSATGGIASSPYNYNNSSISATGAQASPLLLAPFYEDLICQGNPSTLSGLSSSIHYQTSGIAPSRILTVEWSGMETYQNTGPNLNFQVRLYEGSNQIEFVYGTFEGFNGTSTYNYSYSCGINAMYISPVLQTGELLTQQVANSSSFGFTASNNLNFLPSCNSSLLLSPDGYSPVSIPVVPPSNDDVSGVIGLHSNASPCTDLCGTYYSTLGATASGLPACSGGLADDDVWFNFIASNPNTTIKVLGSGGFDPVIELYSSAMSLVSCMDATGTGAFESLSTTNLTAGNSYYIRVYHKNSGSGISSGQFSICVSATPLPPINDECINAIPLDVKSVCNPVVGTQTVAATASVGIPSCFATGTLADDDVWYKFIALNKQEVITVQSGNGFNAVVQLFSGSCGNLTALACLNASSTAQAEVVYASNLVIGQSYYIRVYHAAAGGGSGNFSICVSSPDPACPSGLTPVNATTDIPSTGTQFSWLPVSNANSYEVYLDTINPPALLLTTVNDTTAFSGPLHLGYTYYWRVIPVNATGRGSGCNSLVFATQPYAYPLNIKVFLEGFYTGNRTMIASVDPVLRDTLADTITVCLANRFVPHQILYSTKALLSTNGLAPAYFPQPALLNSYYIVVKHRNSLETWSSVIFAFNYPDTTYDFTHVATSAFGSNLLEVEPGVFALRTGDVNQDGFVNVSDLNAMESELSQLHSGYYSSDLNGDRIVESDDYSMVENRLSLLLFTTRP